MLLNYIVNIVLSNATLTQSYLAQQNTCVYIEFIDFFFFQRFIFGSEQHYIFCHDFHANQQSN